jgi:hypothetical protein
VLNIYNFEDSSMKLQELAAPDRKKQTRQVMEQYFGRTPDYQRLSVAAAQRMLRRVRGLIQEHRYTTARHYSEQEPAYLRLIMLEQALAQHVQEEMIPVAAPATSTAKPATQNSQTAQKTTVDVKDPKLAAALKKSQAGQSLTPDEQKMVSSAALMQQESRLKRALVTLKESEVQQAQVVLAAQDMVDNIQGMIEDATEMQFKELPALVDSIRNQIGMDQAMQFQQEATAALTGLVQALQGTKTNLEQGLGVVTGQAQATPALDAAMSAADSGAAPVPGEEEVDLSLDANLPAEEPEEPQEPAGTQGALGRGRR